MEIDVELALVSTEIVWYLVLSGQLASKNADNDKETAPDYKLI